MWVISLILFSEWRPKAPGYLLLNDHATAIHDPDLNQSAQSAPDTDQSPSSSPLMHTQYSKHASFQCGHSVMLRVEGAGEQSAQTGVGLAVSDVDSNNVLQKGVLFVNSLGVYSQFITIISVKYDCPIITYVTL